MNIKDSYMRQEYPHICFEESWKFTHDTYFKLGQCSAIIDSISNLPLSPDIRGELLQVALIKGTHATTAIEGNTLSEEEILAISKGTELPESRKYLEIEVRNIIDALNLIFDDVVNKDNIALVDERLILTFHSLVGKDLGEHFDAIPGKLRTNNVYVGAYRPPDHKYVKDLMRAFCEWLKKVFCFQRDEKQDFCSALVESMVAHVYIAWIHPFGDGNGRTARLLEFYILLRHGLPNICSHILSNHYNRTRTEYYRQLSMAGKKRDLTAFIEYAVQGMYDGLNEVLAKVQEHQMRNSWVNYVFRKFDDAEIGSENKRKRMRTLVLKMRFNETYTVDQIITGFDFELVQYYKDVSERTIHRDLKELVELKLLVKKDKGFSANSDMLLGDLPSKRNI